MNELGTPPLSQARDLEQAIERYVRNEQALTADIRVKCRREDDYEKVKAALALIAKFLEREKKRQHRRDTGGRK